MNSIVKAQLGVHISRDFIVLYRCNVVMEHVFLGAKSGLSRDNGRRSLEIDEADQEVLFDPSAMDIIDTVTTRHEIMYSEALKW